MLELSLLALTWNDFFGGFQLDEHLFVHFTIQFIIIHHFVCIYLFIYLLIYLLIYLFIYLFIYCMQCIVLYCIALHCIVLYRILSYLFIIISFHFIVLLYFWCPSFPNHSEAFCHLFLTTFSSSTLRHRDIFRAWTPANIFRKRPMISGRLRSVEIWLMIYLRSCWIFDVPKPFGKKS